MSGKRPSGTRSAAARRQRDVRQVARQREHRRAAGLGVDGRHHHRVGAQARAPWAGVAAEQQHREPPPRGPRAGRRARGRGRLQVEGQAGRHEAGAVVGEDGGDRVVGRPLVPADEDVRQRDQGQHRAEQGDPRGRAAGRRPRRHASATEPARNASTAALTARAPSSTSGRTAWSSRNSVPREAIARAATIRAAATAIIARPRRRRPPWTWPAPGRTADSAAQLRPRTPRSWPGGAAATGAGAVGPAPGRRTGARGRRGEGARGAAGPCDAPRPTAARRRSAARRRPRGGEDGRNARPCEPPAAPCRVAWTIRLDPARSAPIGAPPVVRLGEAGLGDPGLRTRRRPRGRGASA